MARAFDEGNEQRTAYVASAPSGRAAAGEAFGIGRSATPTASSGWFSHGGNDIS
jgi:hypothetical protein